MSDFITLYTDASLNVGYGWAKVAYRGKCKAGEVYGTEEITSTDIHEAEMMAMLIGIQKAHVKFPDLIGFFVNSDNLNCVQSFWNFGKYANYKTPKICLPIKEEILKIVGDRWIRTKHVKAHTRGKDVRSHMNRTVDRMARK